jgi:hypothetical protein
LIAKPLGIGDLSNSPHLVFSDGVPDCELKTWAHRPIDFIGDRGDLGKCRWISSSAGSSHVDVAAEWFALGTRLPWVAEVLAASKTAQFDCAGVC